MILSVPLENDNILNVILHVILEAAVKHNNDYKQLKKEKKVIGKELKNVQVSVNFLLHYLTGSEVWYLHNSW